MSDEYEFWLLDLDGTLVDVEDTYIHQVCREVGDRLGVSISDRQAEHLWYGFDDTRERALAEVGLDPETFWATFHSVDEPGARAAATHIYPDAPEFVAALDSPTGLVTHCQAYLTGPILEQLGIDNWFDTVVCCDEETGWKPDPRPLELAMEQLGVAGNGGAGAMVGDDPRDVAAAHSAGLDAVHVDRHDRERLGGGVESGRRVTALTDLVR